MELKECRIGLWVYLFGDAVQLTPDHLVYLLARNSTPEPITLTEDWLKRFGFEKFDSYDFGIKMNLVPRYDLNNISIQLSENVFWYTRREYDGGTSEPFEPVIEVHFVHSLQNLYFALTGTELVLSNKPEEI